MFRAIIISKKTYDEIFELVEGRVTVFPGTGHFRLLAAAEEEFPPSILKGVQPVVFDSDYEGPINPYQKYFHQMDEIPGFVYKNGSRVSWEQMNRDLMSMKSKLSFTLTEMFSPDQVFFNLEIVPNDVVTRRKYRYRLRYSDIDCDASEEFIKMFRDSLQVEIGPLLVSSWTLNYPDVPQWYTQETFRDLVELGDLSLDKLKVITGANSGHIYLFHKNPINLLDEVVDKFIENLRGQISSLIQIRIFPRNTPPEIIKNKRLVSMPNGKWRLNYKVPDQLLFENLSQRSFLFRSADELFWFMALLMQGPGWTAIESELKIFIEPNQIRVTYESKYLPDILKVLSAARVTSPTDDAVKVYYPKRLSKFERDRLAENVYIQLYDQANQESCILVTNDSRADSLELRRTGNFSDRFSVD